MTYIKTGTIKTILSGTLLCLTSFMTLTVQAAFITDKIIVEVHAQRFSQGALLKNLTSGSSVKVVMSDGKYTRVLTSDNITGWVESKFLTNEKPVQLEYLELLSKSKTLEARLKAAEEKQGKAGDDGINIAEIEELRKRATDAGWMRVELKKARDRALMAEKKLKTRKQTANSSQDELNALQNQNKELQERLSAAMLVSEQQQEVVVQDVTAATDAVSSSSDAGNEDWSVKLEWFFSSIVVALIIGLIAGMAWLDKRSRQRHGGFRIY